MQQRGMELAGQAGRQFARVMLSENLSQPHIVAGWMRHMGVLGVERGNGKARVMAFDEVRQPVIGGLDGIDAVEA